MVFCNNAAVHSGGDIWFSDSSRRLPHRAVEGRHRREHRHRPAAAPAADGTVEVVLDGLRFANGVALAADESYVASPRPAGRTVVRLWLTGPRAGQATSSPTDLPGYPDNIAAAATG